MCLLPLRKKEEEEMRHVSLVWNSFWKKNNANIRLEWRQHLLKKILSSFNDQYWNIFQPFNSFPSIQLSSPQQQISCLIWFVIFIYWDLFFLGSFSPFLLWPLNIRKIKRERNNLYRSNYNKLYAFTFLKKRDQKCVG